jgi:lipopolysaccharide transport system ATP-binding protein
MSNDILIRVEGVSKKFCRSLRRSLWYGVKDTTADLFGYDAPRHHLRRDEFWAVDDVSFELRRGECLGLVGRNGAGKTTLLKMLNGLIKPDRGRVEMRGRVGALIALGAGFNPILTGRENIYINGSVLGLSRKEIEAKVDDIIDFAEIGDFIDAPVQSYSSGMTVRLGFAVATALNPDVLLLDEVLAVGDASFRAKCTQRLGTLVENAAVIVVSHYAHQIQKLCNAALLMRNGKAVNRGKASEVLATYALADVPVNKAGFSVLGDEVLDVAIIDASKETHHGGKLNIKAHINLLESVRCDQAYLNISDHADNIQAQVILEGLIRSLNRGTNEVAISVGPIFLSKGRYFGTLVLWTAGGKKTLAVVSNCFQFENEGPVSLGTSYYPPAKVICSTDTMRPGVVQNVKV